MADNQMEDLGTLTAETIAAADAFLVNDDDDTTNDAGGEPKTITFAAIGGMQMVTGSDADTTMDVGKMYVVDMSAWATAVRTYRLPTTAAVGDRIGIAIAAGNATHELAVRTVAASNDTINGVDYDSADWSKLFIAGEVVIFRCVTADTAWVVEYDGRIPSEASISRQTTQSITSATTTTVQCTTLDYATGMDTDIVTNYTITTRRAGIYAITATLSYDSLSDGKIGSALVDKNGSLIANIGIAVGAATSPVPIAPLIVKLSDGDVLKLQAYHDNGTSRNTRATAEWNYPRMVIKEFL